MDLAKIEHRLATVELTPEDCLALAAVLKGASIDDLDGRARLLVGTFAAAFEGIAMAAASESYLGFREIDRFTLAHVRERLSPWRTTGQAPPAAGEGGA